MRMNTSIPIAAIIQIVNSVGVKSSFIMSLHFDYSD